MPFKFPKFCSRFLLKENQFLSVAAGFLAAFFIFTPQSFAAAGECPASNDSSSYGCGYAFQVGERTYYIAEEPNPEKNPSFEFSKNGATKFCSKMSLSSVMPDTVLITTPYGETVKSRYACYVSEVKDAPAAAMAQPEPLGDSITTEVPTTELLTTEREYSSSTEPPSTEWTTTETTTTQPCIAMKYAEWLEAGHPSGDNYCITKKAGGITTWKGCCENVCTDLMANPDCGACGTTCNQNNEEYCKGGTDEVAPSCKKCEPGKKECSRVIDGKEKKKCCGDINPASIPGKGVYCWDDDSPINKPKEDSVCAKRCKIKDLKPQTTSLSPNSSELFSDSTDTFEESCEDDSTTTEPVTTQISTNTETLTTEVTTTQSTTNIETPIASAVQLIAASNVATVSTTTEDPSSSSEPLTTGYTTTEPSSEPSTTANPESECEQKADCLVDEDCCKKKDAKKGQCKVVIGDDRNNCGRCGKVCGDNKSCAFGVCVSSTTSLPPTSEPPTTNIENFSSTELLTTELSSMELTTTLITTEYTSSELPTTEVLTTEGPTSEPSTITGTEESSSTEPPSTEWTSSEDSTSEPSTITGTEDSSTNGECSEEHPEGTCDDTSLKCCRTGDGYTCLSTAECDCITSSGEWCSDLNKCCAHGCDSNSANGCKCTSNSDCDTSECQTCEEGVCKGCALGTKCCDTSLGTKSCSTTVSNDGEQICPCLKDCPTIITGSHCEYSPSPLGGWDCACPTGQIICSDACTAIHTDQNCNDCGDACSATTDTHCKYNSNDQTYSCDCNEGTLGDTQNCTFCGDKIGTDRKCTSCSDDCTKVATGAICGEDDNGVTACGCPEVDDRLQENCNGVCTSLGTDENCSACGDDCSTYGPAGQVCSGAANPWCRCPKDDTGEYQIECPEGCVSLGTNEHCSDCSPCTGGLNCVAEQRGTQNKTYYDCK